MKRLPRLLRCPKCRGKAWAMPCWHKGHILVTVCCKTYSDHPAVTGESHAAAAAAWNRLAARGQRAGRKGAR